MFTARYGLMPYIKQTTFRLQKVKILKTVFSESVVYRADYEISNVDGD